MRRCKCRTASYFVVQLEGPSQLVLGGGDGGAVGGEQELAEVYEAVPVAVEGGEDELGHDVAVVLRQHRRQHRGNLVTVIVTLTYIDIHNMGTLKYYVIKRCHPLVWGNMTV